MTAEEWCEEFKAEFERMEKPWEAGSVRCDCGSLDVIPADDGEELGEIRVEMKAYGRKWLLPDVPSPHAVARFANNFLTLLTTHTTFAGKKNWRKLEGFPISSGASTRLPKLDGRPPKYRLVVRQQWEPEVWKEFDTRNEWVSIYGRFGRFPRECIDEGVYEARTLVDDSAGVD